MPTDDLLTTPTTDEARAQRRGLQVALQHLAGAAHRPASDRIDAWKADVLGALGEVRDALARHATFTEAPDGLFADVVAHAPHLANAVRRLHDEHGSLATDVDHCEGRVRELGHGEELDVVLDLLEALHARFERHRHRGAQLVLDAYNVDVSTGD